MNKRTIFCNTMCILRTGSIRFCSSLLYLALVLGATSAESQTSSDRVNVALASNGAVASASSQHSSAFPVESINNGDRTGANWAAGGGWNDGTQNVYPDSVEIDFNDTKVIDEINVFTIQDNFPSPVEPTEGMTFTQFGITAFDIQFWNGSDWVTVPGGGIRNNNKVGTKVLFPALQTTKIRVLVTDSLAGFSRIIEVEALGGGIVPSPTPTTTPTPIPGQSVLGNGTPGKVSKWLDRGTIGDSAITELNGNIGIGTASPTAKLTVAGTSDSGFVLSATSTGQGGGVFAGGGRGSNGFGGAGGAGLGGNGGSDRGGVGLFGRGGFSSGDVGGDGATVVGGVGTFGGFGLFAEGGIGSNSGSAAVFGFGGSPNSGPGGRGLIGFGGFGVGVGDRGGDGVVGIAGLGEGGATNGLAGLFEGDVEVTGRLTKAGGSFKIDHPLDPENRYLSHSFVESPDMMNVYNGNITTDQNGEAIIELPNWFEALNKDFRYQLTIIGAFAQATVAEKIKDNHFTIRTSMPNVEVSWQVTGIRRDPWADRNRIEVEEEKSERERGHYLFPELYEQPKENSVESARHPDMMHQLKQRRLEIEQRRHQSSP